MDNKKKLTIVIALLAVVCVFAVLVFSGIIDFNKQPVNEEPSTDDGNQTVTDVLSYKATGSDVSPYLSTPVDRIYYTINTDGKVSFYRFENNGFTPVEATGTYTTTVTLSEEKISADITYYKSDDGICGYGLHTVTDGTYTLYPYAFFYLRDYGEDYKGASSSGCMLFVDTTEDDFYADNKVYEESFFFKYEEETASRSLAEASRTIGLNGAKRSDYFMFTDKVVDGSVDRQLFISGRFYSEFDTTEDLFRSGGSGNNTDNIRLAKNVLGKWAQYTDDGIMYITVNDNGDVVVRVLDESTEETTDIKTFDGVGSDDILVSGDYIYVISENMLYSVADDKEVKIKLATSDFAADMVEIDDGVVFLRGYEEKAYATMVIASAETGDVRTICRNELCRSFVSPSIVDGQIVVNVGNDSQFTYYIF